ncbi:hypothetical protein EVG20_g3570 [Dentipellis fragilis]|uniref:G-patch domain-containing protein n=1 Tax=Dentipellis fragilis TaxID=205917 RepID=A0A4Y9Z3D7_9AGAM|nr:hypothetical protein EVG20_g3570 [Dentipellis fragilis]
MATVAHIIRSDYDPAVDRERLQRETGQPLDEPVEGPEEDPWQTESSFGPQRRRANAPHFVPATISFDEWGSALTSTQDTPVPSTSDTRPEVAGWYRSLTKQAPGDSRRTSSLPHASTSAPPPIAAPSASHPSDRPPKRRKERDWFISRALSSDPASAPPTPAPTSTLADILSRDPPAEKPLRPPVFLHLGPSNKGWEMLQNRGWSEGEGLGRGVARRADAERVAQPPPPPPRASARPVVRIKQEEVQLDDDIVEVRQAQLIDLTLSDSENDNEDADEDLDADGARPSSASLAAQPPAVLDAPHDVSSTQTALLTPIPTALKSDRLGIGLKAKTEGPYRASVKRVTHNAAALAAHVKAGEDLRRRQKLVGRGKRGFERSERIERQRRQDLMAYLNH